MKIKNEPMLFHVEEKDSGTRIDKYLSSVMNDFTRSYIQKLIQEEKVYVDHKVIKANYKLSTGNQITLDQPEPKELMLEPENLPLDILYEDNDIIVVNKTKGMVVHPAAGHYTGTLVNGLLYHCKDDLSGINGILRPGIVHRIDMNTTGVLVVCKNDNSHHSIAEQLKVHSITRKYNAIVYNSMKEEKGTVNKPIGRHPIDRKKMAINEKHGKQAITHYRLIDNLSPKFSHIECTLETGRTHQIRVHMASIQHPLLGDDIYGPNNDTYQLEGQTLHARVLGFIHPTTKEYIEFEAPLPEYFQKLLMKLKK